MAAIGFDFENLEFDAYPDEEADLDHLLLMVPQDDDQKVILTQLLYC